MAAGDWLLKGAFPSRQKKGNFRTGCGEIIRCCRERRYLEATAKRYIQGTRGMATASIMFNIPIIDGFWNNARRVIDEYGGIGGFFGSLTDKPDDVVNKLAPDFMQQKLLYQLLDDTSFQTSALARLSEGDRSFAVAFLEGWEMWARIAPRQAAWIRLGLLPVDHVFEGPMPRVVNDVFNCISTISLEAFEEDFMVRTLFKLSEADKSIGGPEVLVMAGTLSSFLTTVGMMMRSLILNEDERGLYHFVEYQDALRAILDRLDRIRETVEELRTQFEGMRQSD
jgi:hypothetical protein